MSSSGPARPLPPANGPAPPARRDRLDEPVFDLFEKRTVRRPFRVPGAIPAARLCSGAAGELARADAVRGPSARSWLLDLEGEFPREKGSHLTHRWRKADSNRWSHLRVSTTAATGLKSPTASI